MPRIPSNHRPPASQASAERDRTWLAGLRAGQFDTFQAMFETLTPELWRFARLTVPADVAEDLVQDVMFDFWQRRETIEIEDGLTPYLFGAVRNRVWKHLRHERVVARTEETVSLDVLPGMGAEPPSPEDDVIADDLRTAVAAALANMSEIQRTILTLRWTHGMTYEQIARTLSISVAAAKQQASRTQRLVRPLLARFLDRRP